MLSIFLCTTSFNLEYCFTKKSGLFPEMVFMPCERAPLPVGSNTDPFCTAQNNCYESKSINITVLKRKREKPKRGWFAKTLQIFSLETR